MSYLSYVRFDVKPGQRDAFLAAFEAADMLGRPRVIDGYKWGKLNEAIDGSHFFVVAEWETEADYAAWQAIAIREIDRSVSRAFTATLLDAKPGALFRTVLSSEAASP